MSRPDYIMRMIERVGQMMIALRKRILAGEVTAQEMQHQLRFAASTAGIDLDIARAATPEMLDLLIAPNGEMDTTRCWMLAEILYLDGLEADRRGEEAAAERSLRNALRLYSLVEPGGSFLVGWPEASERMREIRQLLWSDS